MATSTAPQFQWETADPAAMGLDVKALADHQALCERTGADACLVVYKGKIVQEYLRGGTVKPLNAMSSTKSITALLVGMLIDDGKIKSVDERVCTYLEDWCEGQKGKVTLRHLLTMTAGLANKQGNGVPSAADKNAFVRNEPLIRAPGEKWEYSNEGVQLLSPVLEKAAGEPVQDFARKRLFEPLGMHDTILGTDSVGHARTYAEMYTTPRDFARIGLMMIARGAWQGKQIVSNKWVAEATRPAVEINSYTSRYGYLWWLSPKNDLWMALGQWHNDLLISPTRELVVVRMQKYAASPDAEIGYYPDVIQLFEKIPPLAAGAGS